MGKDLINLLPVHVYKFHLKMSFKQSSENMFTRQSIVIISSSSFFLQCPLFNIFSNTSHLKTLMSFGQKFVSTEHKYKAIYTDEKTPTKKHNKTSIVSEVAISVILDNDRRT